MVENSANGSVYSIDSSSLIAAWTQRYRPRHFRSFWSALDGLIATGRLRASSEVKREISRKDDGLQRWAEERPELFCSIDLQQQEHVREIVAEYPYMTKDFRARNRADVWVIALALVEAGSVVTEEGPGTPNRPKIPLVCDGLRIPHLTLADLIEAEGWEF